MAPASAHVSTSLARLCLSIWVDTTPPDVDRELRQSTSVRPRRYSLRCCYRLGTLVFRERVCILAVDMHIPAGTYASVPVATTNLHLLAHIPEPFEHDPFIFNVYHELFHGVPVRKGGIIEQLHMDPLAELERNLDGTIKLK
ncbi:hypothetical protein EJ07DRAFT_156895 [Lizonia empirigonia]|nr:hypothetical protein EJ07DRAFT_156895 [Lizonia empirigonia]